MPTDKAWTMNCVLAGAKAIKLAEENPWEAKQSLRNLTSEFDEDDLIYLLQRLSEIEMEEK